MTRGTSLPTFCLYFYIIICKTKFKDDGNEDRWVFNPASQFDPSDIKRLTIMKMWSGSETKWDAS